MTNEEAIKELKEFQIDIGSCEDDLDNSPLYYALDMAIKALEQQPCDDATLKDIFCMGCEYKEQQPSADCISRQALLDKLEKPMNWTDSEAEIQEQRDYEGFVELLKSMPSVIPKGVTITDFADKCKECGKILNDKLQTKWIPCSERLPEEAGVYLVSMFRLGYPQREVDGFVCGRWERFGNDVIAWCEIPQPYKAESEEENE